LRSERVSWIAAIGGALVTVGAIVWAFVERADLAFWLIVVLVLALETAYCVYCVFWFRKRRSAGSSSGEVAP
jgi:hypothetical protein